MKSSMKWFEKSVFDINNFYLINALFYMHLGLIGAMYIVYFYNYGLTKLSTNVLSSLFTITVFLMEIPTGAYADIFGIRKCLLLSGIFLTSSMATFLIGNSLYFFALAQILWGLSFAFESGALEAWMVNRSGFKGQQLDNAFARSRKINSLLSILGGLIAGLLSGLSLKWPWFLSLLTALLYLMLVYRGVDDEKIENEKKVINVKHGLLSMRSIIGTSISYSINNVTVKTLIIFNIVISFCFSPVFVYWSPYLSALFNKGTWILGWIWVVIKIANYAGNSILERISKCNVNRKLTMGLSLICISVALIIAALSSNFYIVLLMFITFEILIEIITPLQNAIINEWIPNEERATVLSFNSMICRLSNFFSLLIMGYIGDKISMQYTWIISGILILTNLVVLSFLKEIEKKVINN